eukprot:EC798486.1.p2 GENE.EC798486.1~~EC798486.1.p2  ORF type:complete len:241 (+),score=98.03 EC798486.1:69-725(+)
MDGSDVQVQEYGKELRYELGVVMGKLGEWWNTTGGTEQALQSFSGASAQFRAADPDGRRPEVQHALSLTYIRIGDTMFSVVASGGAGEDPRPVVEKARNAYDRAVSLRKRALDVEPDSVQKAVELAIALGFRARVSDSDDQARYLLGEALRLIHTAEGHPDSFKIVHYKQLFEQMLETLETTVAEEERAAAASAAASAGDSATTVVTDAAAVVAADDK